MLRGHKSRLSFSQYESDLGWSISVGCLYKASQAKHCIYGTCCRSCKSKLCQLMMDMKSPQSCKIFDLFRWRIICKWLEVSRKHHRRSMKTALSILCIFSLGKRAKHGVPFALRMFWVKEITAISSSDYGKKNSYSYSEKTSYQISLVR